MKILVTGGTGFIGGSLAERLVKEGHEVRCLVRKTSNVSFLDKLGVEKIYGDIENISSLETAMKDIDTVYNMVGILGKWKIPEEIFWRTHVNGTKNILDASINAGIKKLVHCSTAGVLGVIEKLPADESYPYNPYTIYETTKVEAEKLVFEYHNKYKLPVTIIRPELVYGPRDLFTLKFFQAVKRGFFPIIGNGNNTCHLVYIDDLVKAFMLCIDKKATGDAYLIGGESYITMNELLTNMANALGVKPPGIHIPIKLVSIMATMMEFSGTVLNFEPILTKSRVRFFTENKGSSYAKAKKELGYVPDVSLEDGLRRSVEWYRKNGML